MVNHEDALMEMSVRVSSEGLSRAVHQIVGTLRVGGNSSICFLNDC